jgi:soluble lytic murein transglycosylase-like protein
MLLLLVMMYVVQEQQRMLIPVSTPNCNQTLMKLQTLGIDSKEIALSIDLASRQSGLSQNFLIALMYTESTGDPRAKSSMNYRGLMQIPWPVYYTDANMIIGAHIFNEKLKITNRNVERALCLYKGYPVGSERGLMQARKVLRICDKLSKVST